MPTSQSNPWKNVVIFGGVAFVAFLAAGGVIAYLDDRPPAAEAPAAEPVAAAAPAATAAASQPPARIVEDCNRYAAGTHRDKSEIAKDGLLGGAVGAGLGAAAGAIASGGSGAGKGAGIGALVGVAGGAVYGLDKENRRSEAATQAYRACLARNGY